MASRDPEPSGAPAGPVLFAYDGSELAAYAIEQAALQLAGGRDALILCVWQPGDVGFVTPEERHFDASAAGEVRSAALETAAHGASLAQRAGFRAHSAEVNAAPTWKGIVEVASEREASLIVLGSHHRSGLAGRLLGSVAGAVAAHSQRSVLIVHRPS